MQTSFPRLLALLAAASLPAIAFASNNGSDNAGNYTLTGWTDGSNGGTGFEAWRFSNNAGGGFFIGDSTAGSGNINTGNQSFGIFANPGTAFANADRTFAGGTLSVGQTFSLQLAVNFRNGNKGFNLFAGGSSAFNFNIADPAGYQVNTASGSTTLALSFQSNSVFTLSFTQTNATTMAVSIIRTSSAGTENAYSANLAVSNADSFRIYNSGTGDGSAANNIYANNLAIIPEPSTVALLGVGCLAGVAALHRRRA